MVFKPVKQVLAAAAVLACSLSALAGERMVAAGGGAAVGGGVAANSRLRALAQERCDAADVVLRVPRAIIMPIVLTTITTIVCPPDTIRATTGNSGTGTSAAPGGCSHAAYRWPSR